VSPTLLISILDFACLLAEMMSFTIIPWKVLLSLREWQ